MSGIDKIGKLKYLIENTSYGLPYLIETWQGVIAIDSTVWAKAVTGTGAITDPPSKAEEPYQKVILSGPANADTARLYTVQEWQLAPDTWGQNTFNKLLIMEWEVKLATVASIDNDHFFMGLSAVNNATRASNNIAGFILTADALNAITDDGVGETVSAVGAPTLTNWNKLKIVAYNAIIEFYVNEVMQARHTTTAGEDLPDVNAHGMFYLPQEAAANGGELHIGTVSIRPGVLL